MITLFRFFTFGVLDGLTPGDTFFLFTFGVLKGLPKVIIFSFLVTPSKTYATAVPPPRETYYAA